MEIVSREGAALIARWVHFLAGITWIGLLYYFSFVQTPVFAGLEAGVRTTMVRTLVPRALAWGRYAALVTVLAGVGIIIVRIDAVGWANWDDLLTSSGAFGRSSWGIAILSGMTLGTIMLLNVWGVIWPNQKIVIASAEQVAAGGEADPRAADAGRRALLALRTTVVFSIPTLFFMATASHLTLFSIATASQKWSYAIIAGAVVLLVELNALIALTGPTTKPLEGTRSTILAGFILWAILYVILQVTTS